MKKTVIKRFPALGLNIFVQNIFNNRNLPEIKKKNMLTFNHTKESVSSKNAVRLFIEILNKTVSEI